MLKRNACADGAAVGEYVSPVAVGDVVGCAVGIDVVGCAVGIWWWGMRCRHGPWYAFREQGGKGECEDVPCHPHPTGLTSMTHTRRGERGHRRRAWRKRITRLRGRPGRPRRGCPRGALRRRL